MTNKNVSHKITVAITKKKWKEASRMNFHDNFY